MSPMIWVISVSLAEADGSAARVGRVKLSPIRASDPCARALVEERRAGRLIARKLARKVLIPVEELHRWASALLTDEIRWFWLLPTSVRGSSTPECFWLQLLSCHPEPVRRAT